MDDDALLTINDLHTYYFTARGAVKAVDGVTLSVRKGEALGIVGESGSGKTTLAYSIIKLLPESASIVRGNAWFQRNGEGLDLTNLTDEQIRKVRGKNIGMVFQDPMTYLNPAMRVYDQIAEPLMYHMGYSLSEARERAIELLAKVRIPEPPTVARYYPHQLSGGMRQRVIIAIAISCNPQLLIADEPTTALDVTIEAQILDLIKQLQRELDMTLILITHDLGIVAETCDRVAIMYAGKIVEEGDIYSLYTNPKHPYTQGLLSASLSIEEFKERISTIEGSAPDLINPPTGCRFHPRCPYAMQRCVKEQPSLIRLDEGSRVACWLRT